MCCVGHCRAVGSLLCEREKERASEGTGRTNACLDCDFLSGGSTVCLVGV